MSFAKNIIQRFLMPLAIMFFATACTTELIGKITGVSKIGVGKTKISQITQNMIGDMRLFFSKQLIFDSAQDCPARILLLPQKLENESAERIDFRHIVDDLKKHMNNPEQLKKLSLVGRKLAFLDQNRNFIAGKSLASKCVSKKSGADYLLAGRIISDDKIDKNDIRQRQTLISFWLLDLETGAKAWTSPSYIFKSYGQNDVIYR